VTRRSTSGIPAVVRICAIGTVLALILVALRAKIVFTRSDLRSPGRLIGGLVIASYADIAYVAGLTGGFVVLCLLARSGGGVRKLLVGAFAAAACVSLILGFVNVRAVAELGRPVNYQWLYYSHFMRSMDSYTALAALLSWSWVATVLAACLALLLASYLLARVGGRALSGPGVRPWTAAAAAGACVSYLALGWGWRGSGNWSAATLENPVVTLATSVFDAGANPVLARMPTDIGPDDFLTAGARDASVTSTPFTARARKAGVRNVIVVVLESVGAEYLWGFGAAESGRMPELERYQRSARRYVNFYAHQPSTTHTLVALLLADYPPHSFRVLTREHPDIALPSLSGELKAQGYRTAFINAEDVGFQGADAFLAHRRFDLVEDASSGPCAATPGSTPPYDDCMVRKLTNWIGRDSVRPFFAVLWTYQTHFPYLAPSGGEERVSPPAGEAGQQASDSQDVRFARYLRALRETDKALGKLLQGLEQRGQLDSTLVVVLGDHGEAFGQHGNSFHRYLYEEEVHVPLLLINPRLFHGESDSAIGGTIDLAPTVMDLLGYRLPAEWQGRSLFDPHRTGRVYLFGPYSGLFGYRDGSRKLIYDAIADHAALYDLASDPRETINIAGSHPAAVREGRERLAAWVQFQNRFYRQYGVSR
jgi:lipoteichoic acid synthase